MNVIISPSSNNSPQSQANVAKSSKAPLIGLKMALNSLHQTIHRSISSNSILDSYLEKLKASQSVKEAKAKTNDSLFNEIESQMKDLKDLQKHVQELKNEIKNGLNPDQLKQLQGLLNQLVAQYNQDLADLGQATNQYNKLKAKYDGLKDKSSDKAKELKKEMGQAKEKINLAESKINQVITKVNKLISKISDPILKQDLKSLVSLMEKGGNIGNITNTISNRILKLSDLFEQKQNMINQSEAQIQFIVNSLNQLINQLKEFVNHLEKDTGNSTEVEKTLNNLKNLEKVISRQFQDDHYRHQNYKQERLDLVESFKK